MLISFMCHVTSTHWEALGLNQKVPPQDMLSERARDGSELTNRTAATERVPFASDCLPHNPAASRMSRDSLLVMKVREHLRKQISNNNQKNRIQSRMCLDLRRARESLTPGKGGPSQLQS